MENPPPSILLVEDNELLSKVLFLWLKDDGYEVLPAKTGAEARAHASQDGVSIDLLLTDICLPDTDGVTLAGELMDGGNIAHLLYMSAIPLAKHRAESRDVDSDLFLAKPFARAELKQKIGETLNQ